MADRQWVNSGKKSFVCDPTAFSEGRWSLFDWYVFSAVLAVKMGLSLPHVWNKYVKQSASFDLQLVTKEQWRFLFRDEFPEDSEAEQAEESVAANV